MLNRTHLLAALTLVIATAPSALAQAYTSSNSAPAATAHTNVKIEELNFTIGGIKVQTEATFTYEYQGARWQAYKELDGEQVGCLKRQVAAAQPVLSSPENRKYLNEIGVNTLKLSMNDNSRGVYKDQDTQYGPDILNNNILSFTVVLNTKGVCKFASTAELANQFAQWRQALKKKNSEDALAQVRALAASIEVDRNDPKAVGTSGPKAQPKVVSDNPYEEKAAK